MRVIADPLDEHYGENFKHVVDNDDNHHDRIRQNQCRPCGVKIRFTHCNIRVLCISLIASKGSRIAEALHEAMAAKGLTCISKLLIVVILKDSGLLFLFVSKLYVAWKRRIAVIHWRILGESVFR